MKKGTMKARVRYYNEETGKEGYEVSILIEGEWEMEARFPLAARQGGDGQPDFVHYGLLIKLSQLQRLGYAIDLQI